MTAQQSAPLVGVVMGSSSDWEVMRHAVDMLTQFGIPFEAQVVSAHRMPDDMFGYAEAARGRGLRAISLWVRRRRPVPRRVRRRRSWWICLWNHIAVCWS